DAAVDVLFNLESALHYPNKESFIAECARVLKPGGTLCCGDITTNLKVVFAPIEWLNKLPSQYNSNVHLWSGDDYREAFARHGFDVAWHEEASRHVAMSLADGRRELRNLGFWKTLGFRGRMMFLRILEDHLQGAELTYDLFRACKPGGTQSQRSKPKPAKAHH